MTQKTTVFVLDAPNIDMTQGSIMQRRPTPDMRPNYHELYRWLSTRAKPGKLHARFFLNVAYNFDATSTYASWIRSLLDIGFEVFLKRKDAHNNGDIDKDMLDFIREHDRNELSEVIIASHDHENFGALVDELIAEDINVLMLGFEEYLAAFKAKKYDLEKIPRLFARPLIRPYDFKDIPETGRLYTPNPYRLEKSSQPPDEPISASQPELVAVEAPRPIPGPPRILPGPPSQRRFTTESPTAAAS